MWLTSSTFSSPLVLMALRGGSRRTRVDSAAPIRRVHVAQRKLSVMRVERSNAADLVLEGQHLRLEFDPVVTIDVGTDVHLGRLLQIGVAKLEDDIGIADRKPVDVVGPLAKDEGVVVEPKVGRIEEENFPDARLRILEGLAGEIDLGLSRGSLHQPGELVEALDRCETVALEDELGFDVLNAVERVAVAVLAFLARGP